MFIGIYLFQQCHVVNSVCLGTYKNNIRLFWANPQEYMMI